MINSSLYPGSIGRKAIDLVSRKVISAPLIELLKLGPRYDPGGAVSPNFGSKVYKTVQTKKVLTPKESRIKISGVPTKVGETRKNQRPKESGKGGVLDITA